MPVQHYVIPYEHFRDGDDPMSPMWRRLPIATEKELVDKGWWSEAEIDGDKAVVRVRASKGTHKNLATEYKKVEDPKEVWTPERRIVRWDQGEPVLDETMHRSRSLFSITYDVMDDKQHSAFKKEVEQLAKKAKKEGYVRLNHPWAYATRIIASLGEKGYGLDRASTGTFPVNSTVLDNFDRADSTTTLGASWTQDVIASSWNSHGISTNTAYAAANFKSNYWNGTTYGPDTEVWLNISTLQTAGYNGLLSRITNQGTSNVHMYESRWDNSANCPYQLRWDTNGGGTQLGANFFVGFATGNSIGVELIGATITIYKNAGSWTSTGTRTDATYTRAGYTGIITNSGQTTRMNDFVAGSIGATPTFLVPISDITLGDYVPTPASPTTLYDKLDETPASDTDYISGTTTAEVKFG